MKNKKINRMTLQELTKQLAAIKHTGKNYGSRYHRELSAEYTRRIIKQ